MSQSRDEIAEQVVALAGSIGNEKAERMRELVAEARRKGAQASGAPAKWRVEVVHGRARLIVDASGDSGEQSFWINDADTDDEPGHAEFHARMLRIAIGRIVGAPAPASAQEFEIENDHATCLWCDAGPFTYDVGPGGWDEHWRTCEKSPRNKRKTSAPASAQGDVCECGHGRAMHFDEDGDHNGACLYQMNDKPFCRCDMFRAKDKERA